MFKPILCLDFDGVIHSYTSGWQGVGVCNDPPVEGTEEFLYEATKRFRVMIYSSRSKSLRGRWAMRRYMYNHFALPLTFSPDHEHDFLYEAVSYPWFKPSASVTIDDRALTFTGNWADFSIASLKSFQPWNKRSAIAAGSRRAKTPQAVECVASQSGPVGASPESPPSPPHHSLGE